MCLKFEECLINRFVGQSKAESEFGMWVVSFTVEELQQLGVNSLMIMSTLVISDCSRFCGTNSLQV